MSRVATPAPPKLRSPPKPRLPFDQLDGIAVRVAHERNDRRPMFHRPRLPGNGRAGRPQLLADGLDVLNPDRKVTKAGADLVLAAIPVPGQLDFVGSRSRIADEGERELA